MPNDKNRKFFLRSRKSKHTSSFSVLSFSARSFQTLGIFLQFRRTFSKFHRTFSKFQGKKSEKYPTKLCKQHVVSSQTSTSFEKTPHNPAKTSENHDFQSRWESHNSQQLSLSSKHRVKWRGTKRKLLLKTNLFFRSLFIPNRTLDTEQVSLDCWTDVLSLPFGVAVYGENEK